MALYDKMFEFSDNQSVASTTESSNILDMQDDDLELGAGTPIYLNIRVSVAATAGTSLTCALQCSSTTDIDAGTEFDTNRILWQSGAIGYAQLTLGRWVTRIALPVEFDQERYLGLQYTASGTLTNLRVNAWLDHGPQSSYGTQVSTSNI